VVLRIVALAVVAGCGQSLFDSNGEGTVDAPGGTTDMGVDIMVPSSCPTPCLADAGADFDGTPGGMGNRWRYLEDNRDRTWAAMTASGGAFVGADPANRISSCAMAPTAPACMALPGALLVDTAGMTANADPAISFTSTSKQVIQLSVRVHVPAGGTAHIVGLYRNSREDRLYNALAGAGSTVETSLTVDALANDRFYLTLVPAGAGATEIAAHFYVNGTTMTFPVACQLAAQFQTPAGTTIENQCGTTLTSWIDATATMMTPPTLTAGPFGDLGTAADILMDTYYEDPDVLDYAGDSTTQFWMRHDAFVSSYAGWPFSTVDLNNGGGLAFYIYDGPSGKMMEVNTCTNPNTVTFSYVDVDFPDDTNWHFVRAVHVGGNVRVCIDGVRVGSYPPTVPLVTTIHPYIGRNAFWSPQVASFDGAVDDVRMFTGALPCE
jgi:hypothetical protein